VRFSDQCVDALRQLHPDARKGLRKALADLDAGKKRDVAGLAGKLAGFSRLRVGKYRIVFRYDEAGELVAEFLGPRNLVYEQFTPLS